MQVPGKEGIKALVGKRMSKSVKFMDEQIKISKLSVAEVEEIRAASAESEGDEEKGFEVLKTVIRNAVEGASDLSDEDFSGFPIDELSKLSQEIMKFSGLVGDEKEKGK